MVDHDLTTTPPHPDPLDTSVPFEPGAPVVEQVPQVTYALGEHGPAAVPSAPEDPEPAMDLAPDEPEPDLPEGPRPEPVLDQAGIAAGIASIAPVVLGLLVLAGQITQGEAASLTTTVVGVGTGIVVIVNFVAGRWRAAKARALVTPLASPRSIDGEPLMAVTTAAILQRAAENAEPLPEGDPEPTPWDQDSTLRAGISSARPTGGSA